MAFKNAVIKDQKPDASGLDNSHQNLIINAGSQEDTETADINNTNITVSPKLLSEKQHQIGTSFETTKTGAFVGEPSFKMHNDVKDQLLQVPKPINKSSISPPLVGKRVRQTVNSLDDQQWNDFINNVNEIDSESPHDTTAKLTPPKNSLLDTIMKRQRVNSAATKTEFSFMPASFKATKTNSAPTATNSPIFAPTVPTNRRRDQKATLKQFNLGPSAARSPLLQP